MYRIIMWTCKIEIDGKEAHLGSKTLKHKITLAGFPLSFSYQGKWVIVHITGILIGNSKNKKEFVKDLKGSSRLINFELNEDFFIGTIKEPIFAKTIYNKDLIYLAPAIINENGKEIITVGSFDKQILSKFISTLEKNYDTKIHYIQERKIKNISIVEQNPELTDKQKQAMQLAIKNGYYNSPRKTSVENLAKLAGLSFSTFQVHLRKAESKLMPFFFEQ